MLGTLQTHCPPPAPVQDCGTTLPKMSVGRGGFRWELELEQPCCWHCNAAPMQSSWQRDIDAMVQLLSFKQRSHCRAGSACVYPEHGWTRSWSWSEILCPGLVPELGTRAGMEPMVHSPCAEDAELSQGTEGTAVPSLWGLGAQHSKNLVPRGCSFHSCLVTPTPIFVLVE